MARMCPLTGEKVLYQECLECEEKEKCRSRDGNLQAADGTSRKAERKHTAIRKEL